MTNAILSRNAQRMLPTNVSTSSEEERLIYEAKEWEKGDQLIDSITIQENTHGAGDVMAGKGSAGY